MHALATRRMRLKEAQDYEALRALPRVTLVERASCPGGIWREPREQDEEFKMMYNEDVKCFINCFSVMFFVL